MLIRSLQKQILKAAFDGRVAVIQGPRQVGKTTLAFQLMRLMKGRGPIRHFNCDDPDHRSLLENKGLQSLQDVIGDAKIVFIDEGQKLSTIGQTLKILADHYKKKIQVIVTGSSSIHLLDKTQESLTGRKRVYTLYPLSLEETHGMKGLRGDKKILESRLIYGGYPHVVTSRTKDQKVDALKELQTSYLYRDVFDFQGMKNADVFMNLVKALAHQIGNEVSFVELANRLKVNRETVERYLHILEMSFIVFRLPVFTTNKRRELSKLRKVYFYDTGIRNAVINNFSPLAGRQDVGMLWENFMVVERMKYRDHHRIEANQYFWRTYDGSEIDLVEEREGKLFGYEFKWTPRAHPRHLLKWKEYPQASYQMISPEDIKEFVL